MLKTCSAPASRASVVPFACPAARGPTRCSAARHASTSSTFATPSSSTHGFTSFRSSRQQQRSVVTAAIAESDLKFISRTEVPAFIMRDDLIDQLLRWATYEAGDAGVRNFGMPMKIEPIFDAAETLWGYRVSIYKEGVKLTDLSVGFDDLMSRKHEFIGYGADGFPTLEGRVEEIKGKFLEIWKLDSRPVDEDLRGTIRAFCTGLLAALNRYYAFGSVFVDDAQ